MLASKADARKKCYDAVVSEAKNGLARYYIEFPERVGDERAKDALEWSLRGIQRILRILDLYEISEKG